MKRWSPNYKGITEWEDCICLYLLSTLKEPSTWQKMEIQIRRTLLINEWWVLQASITAKNERKRNRRELGLRRQSKLELKKQKKFWKILTKKIPSKTTNKEGEADLKTLSQALEILTHTKHHDFKAHRHKRIKVNVPPQCLRKQRLVLSTEKKQIHMDARCAGRIIAGMY